MQNVFNSDLQKSTIDKEQFERTIYVRVNNDPKIKELERLGYKVIKQDPSSDLILFGLPKKVSEEVEEAGKKAGKNVTQKKT